MVDPWHGTYALSGASRCGIQQAISSRSMTKRVRPIFPILQAKERIAVFVDGNLQLFQSAGKLEYEGEIEYCSASGNRQAHHFYLNLEMYRKGLTFSEETPRTHHELQRIPDLLKGIDGELRRIRQAISVDKVSDIITPVDGGDTLTETRSAN